MLESEFKTIEEYLIQVLFLPAPADTAETIAKREQALEIMRGNIGDAYAVWISDQEIKALQPTTELFTSEKFSNTVLRALSLWHKGDYRYAAVGLLALFEKYTNGDFQFEQLDEANSAFYSRCYLLLCVRYFDHLPFRWQAFFLNSFYFYLALANDMDMEGALKRAVISYLDIKDRRDFSVQFATFIYDNDRTVGIKPDGSAPAMARYWIDEFRLFSHGRFDGESLIVFFNNEERFAYCASIERELIKKALTLYASLISDFYVFADITDNDIEKARQSLLKEKTAAKQPAPDKPAPAKKAPDDLEITQMIEAEFKRDSNGDFLQPAAVFAKLGQLARQYNMPRIAELYYYDEASGKFKWQ